MRSKNSVAANVTIRLYYRKLAVTRVAIFGVFRREIVTQLTVKPGSLHAGVDKVVNSHLDSQLLLYAACASHFTAGAHNVIS
jgi:hypothetical protein